MKDKRKSLFIVFVILVVGVTAFNIYLSKKTMSDGKEKQLKLSNELLTKQNEDLKKRLDKVLPSAQEQQRRAYLSTAETFIQLSFHREKEGYSERKEKAKTIMSEELLQQFYPTDKYELGDTYKTKPIEMKFYLQENEPDKEEVNVLAEFINVTTDSTQNREEKVNNVLRIIMKKDKETWRVTSVEELNMKVL
ncbi:MULTISPECIES: MerR family transcriptional regulator [Bacillus cereus group]|uniref:MerR family transcriptional regulator n=1 Tax=Bacillus cereus group TaxID=86661 RepID=UPI000BF74AB3|nr:MULTISPECIES: MerR family transcriptional regulator [Bacillus cereus group]MCU5131470.1 MerR family transcriptional regulator [Bacillus cereus]KAA0750851.1 MerR family transcriptional regulator [Bacillus sp. BF2-3]MCU5691381.1 MerR family transcriptional regulator [Bacillus cereus]MED3542464.1 MerR family transcriptional regulator [Bacillus toyonensis]MEE2021167.1 MerR family transcriptional regulator [Bacillus toyonensis]